MTLVDFYRQVLSSLKLTEKDGYMYVGSGDGLIPLLAEKKQFVLPTKERLKDLLDQDEDGNAIVARLPYNPLNEDVVKGDTLSLQRTKTYVEKRLGHAIARVGEALLSLASNKKLQTKTNMEINMFLSQLNEANGPNIKQVVDNTSIEKWASIYANSLKEKEVNMVDIYLNKAGVSEGVKYNRLAVLNSPIYDILVDEKTTKDTPILDVKLRNKDLIIFRLMIKYLLEGLNENNCIELGSNDNDSPAFIALYSLYIKLMTRLNKLMKSLLTVDKTLEEDIVDLPISVEDLADLKVFKSELVLIPNENDLNRTLKGPSIRNASVASILNNGADRVKSAAYPTEPVEYNTKLEEERSETLDILASLSPGRGYSSSYRRTSNEGNLNISNYLRSRDVSTRYGYSSYREDPLDKYRNSAGLSTVRGTRADAEMNISHFTRYR